MCGRMCFNKIFWGYIGLIILFILPALIFGPEVMDSSAYAIVFIPASIVANLALVYGVFSRTINVGFSLFAVFLTLIPIVNFWYLYVLLTRTASDTNTPNPDETTI